MTLTPETTPAALNTQSSTLKRHAGAHNSCVITLDQCSAGELEDVVRPWRMRSRNAPFIPPSLPASEAASI